MSKKLVLKITGMIALCIIAVFAATSILGPSSSTGAGSDDERANNGEQGVQAGAQTGRALPRIAILTTDQLQSFYSESTTVKPAEAEQPTDEITEEDLDEAEINIAVSHLSKSVEDHLATELADQLTSSRRFAVAEPLTVTQTLNKLNAELRGEGETGASQEARESREGNPDERRAADEVWEKISQTPDAALKRIGTFFGRVHVSTQSDGSRTAQVDLGSSGGSDQGTLIDFLTSNMDDATERLGVDYLLIVTTHEPRASLVSRSMPYSEETEVFVNVEPVFTYRLFNANPDDRHNNVLVSKVARMDRPIRVRIENLDDCNCVDVNASIALDKANLRLFQNIAGRLTQNLIDTMYPAQISSDVPLTFDRGSDHGVEVGDIFDVYRRAGEVAQAGNGVNIAEAIQVYQGRAEVIRTQKTISHLTALDGAELKRGDMVDSAELLAARNPSSDGIARPIGAADTGAPAKRPFGARAMAAEEAGFQPWTIAISELNGRYENCAECGAYVEESRLLEDALIDRFQDDIRVKILSRRDFAAIAGERGMRDEETGIYRMSREGMGAADFVLTGDIAFRTSNSQVTSSFAGQTRVVGAKSTLSAQGTFRILDPETAAVEETADVGYSQTFSSASGATTQSAYAGAVSAIADKVMRDFTERLFPPLVLGTSANGQVRIAGGAYAGLAPGVRIAVYNLGEMEVDLYTRAPIGRSRTFAGHLKIVDAARETATAEFEGDSRFRISAGDQIEIVSGAATVPQVLRAGGVQQPAREVSTTSGQGDEEPDLPF